jgi:hypothetical protein
MAPNPSPNPLITPAPTPPLHLLARQTDAFDLSSYYDALSSIAAEYSLADYSSLLADYTVSEIDYSSLYEQYSSDLLQYTSLLNALTATDGLINTVTRHTSLPTGTAVGASDGGKKGGLTTGAWIGIGVGIPLAVLLLAGLVLFLWCFRRNKAGKTKNNFVPPMAQTPAQPQNYNPQPQLYPQNQGYQQGYQQPPQQNPQPYAVSPIQQQVPPQYVQPQAGDSNAAFGGYAKGPAPGAVELETEYHFARDGAVEIGDTEAKVEEKKGWRQKLGRKPVPTHD